MGIHIDVYRKGKLFKNGRHSFLNATKGMPFSPLKRLGHWGFADNVLNYGECISLVNYRIGGDVFRPTNFVAIRQQMSVDADKKLNDLLDVVESDDTLYFDFNGHVLNPIKLVHD